MTGRSPALPGSSGGVPAAASTAATTGDRYELANLDFSADVKRRYQQVADPYVGYRGRGVGVGDGSTGSSAGEGIAAVVDVAEGVAVGFGDEVAGGAAGVSEDPQAARTTATRALESQRGAITV